MSASAYSHRFDSTIEAPRTPFSKLRSTIARASDTLDKSVSAFHTARGIFGSRTPRQFASGVRAPPDIKAGPIGTTNTGKLALSSEVPLRNAVARSDYLRQTRNGTTPAVTASQHLFAEMKKVAIAKRNNAPKPKAAKAGSRPGPRPMRLATAPVSVATGFLSTGPRLTQSSNGVSCRIRHRELVIPTLAGSTTYTLQSFQSINPGLSALFSWLASNAQQWEQYVCHKFVVEYVPICGTATQGDIILVPLYDAADVPPATEQQAVNNKGVVMDSVWKPCSCSFNKHAMMVPGNRKWVRNCNIAGDIKTYDVGKLCVATNNCASTATIGKVFIDYDFEFFIPQSDNGNATAPVYTTWLSAPTAGCNNSTTDVRNMSLYVSPLTNGDPLGILKGVQPAGFVVPAGVYRINAVGAFVGATANIQRASFYLCKNGSPYQSWTFDAGGVVSQYATTATGTVMSLFTSNGTDTFGVQTYVVFGSGTVTFTMSDLIFSPA